jgi:hypothetical protein
MAHDERPGEIGERNRMKRTYHSPTLTDLGKVEDLTGGGIGSVKENTGQDPQPTKRP